MAFSKNVLFTFFVVLAKVSTFTDGFVPEGGINDCRVNRNVLLAELLAGFHRNEIKLVGLPTTAKLFAMKRNPKRRKNTPIRKLQFSAVCFIILLLCGDIEVNPGPVSICPICRSTVQQHHHAVSCDRCNYWYHIQCVGISNSMYQEFAKMVSFHWYCKPCSNTAHIVELRKRSNLLSDSKHLLNSKKSKILTEHSYAKYELNLQADELVSLMCMLMKDSNYTFEINLTIFSCAG
jgi:hypothetical protein